MLRRVRERKNGNLDRDWGFQFHPSLVQLDHIDQLPTLGIRKGSRHDDSKPFADPDSYLNVMDLNECLRHVKLSHFFS